MEENKIELVRNFFRLRRNATECAYVLAVPLPEVQTIYDEMKRKEEMFQRTISRMKTFAAHLLLLSLLLTPLTHAQTISPVVVEAGGKKSYTGNFTVQNDGVTPLVAVVEVKGLGLTPLPPTVHVELSQMSARLGAHQQYNFWYRISCDQKPCVVTFNVQLTGPHTASGLAVAIHIPSTVYFCQKAKGCRASVLAARTS